MKDRNKKTYKSFFFIFAFVLNSCLGSFLVGYKLGELNLLLVDLKHIYNWSGPSISIYTGLLNAMLPLGAIVGAILSGNFFSKVGRKWGMIIADIFGIIGSFSCIFVGLGAYPQIIGRFISGIAAGINCQLIPLYINELSPIEISGIMGSFFQCLLSVGILMSYVMGMKIPDESMDYDVNDNWWKLVFAFPILTCAIRISLLLTCFSFDTPFSMMKQRKDDESVAKVMKTIYKDEFIDNVVQNIETKINSYQNVSFKEVITSYRSRLILGIFLMGAQQFSGANAVVTESSTLYDYNGDNQQAKILTIGNSLVLILSALISGWTSDISGRRKIILVGNFACLSCLLLMGIFMEFSSTTMKLVSISMTYLFLFSYGISLGPVIWVYEPEILPDSGISLVVISNWFFCGLVIFSTPILIEKIGISALYFIFMSFVIIFQFYLHFYMKETKGMSAAEVDSIFGMGRKKDEEGSEEEGINNDKEECD